MERSRLTVPKVLHYATTNREGYREYKSRSYICKKCPSRSRCTNSKSYTKTVTRHVWQNYVELAEDIRHTPKYKKLYQKRKETIERVFADAKEKYGMRYTLYRGLTQVTNMRRSERRIELLCVGWVIRQSVCAVANGASNFYLQ
jgi:hypothetical protein